MTLLGQFALWAAFLLGCWSALLAFFGRWQERPALALSLTRTPYAICAVLIVAAAALWKGIFAHDFNIEYVAAYTSSNLPKYYLISAFWAGQKGSMLYWAVVLSIFAALAQALTSSRFKDLLPYVAGVTGVIVAFFVSVMLFGSHSSPFERMAFTPPDGRGLNPQLQNPGMIMHPPMLYLGYIGLTIPFAFAVAALLARKLDTGWIIAMRKWALAAWLFLSIGITIGMWWAYLELGWGGVWMWDPVENASLLPWLTLTAFLHSVMIQEKRGMLKRWNLTLMIGTYLLSIFGTFITRSGAIASVHSFTQSDVGYFFLGFLLVTAILSITLLVTRWPALVPEAQLESLVSRESAFLFNNLALVGIMFSVLWGTLFPILSEAVVGVKMTVGKEFYFDPVNVPLGLFLLLLTGIGPLIAWRKASTANLRRQFIVPVASGLLSCAVVVIGGLRHPYAIISMTLAGFVLGTVCQEFWRGIRARRNMHDENIFTACVNLIARNRRRYGGYIVHVAIVIYFVAFTGLAFNVAKEVELSPGESAEITSPFGQVYKLTHVAVSQTTKLNRQVTSALLNVSIDGKPAGTVVPEKRQHFTSTGEASFAPSTEVGLRSSLREDLYVIYEGSPDGSERTRYKVMINPLVAWFWIGCGILVVGGLLTMWPGGPQIKTARRRAAVQPGYAVSLAGGVE